MSTRRVDPLVAIFLVMALSSLLLLVVLVTSREGAAERPVLIERQHTTFRQHGQEVSCVVEGRLKEGQVVDITFIECEP